MAQTTASPPSSGYKRSKWVDILPTVRAWLYILPAGLLMLVVSFFPQAFQAWMSFTDYRIKHLRFNILNSETWEKFAPPMVGLENFVRVLTSDLAIENYDFVRLLRFNISWTLTNVFFHVGLGIAIALALNHKDLIGRRVYRALFVLPWAIPGLINAFTWRNMFDRRFGAINQLIGKLNSFFDLSFNTDIRWLETSEPPLNGYAGWILGLLVLVPLTIFVLNALLRSNQPFVVKIIGVLILGLADAWLLNGLPTDPLSYYAVLMTNIWLGWPFMTVIATGALQSIPEELYEAARMDGASGWQQIWRITLPLIQPAMIPAVMVGTIWTFNNFNVIYFISAGDPFGRTELLVTQAFKLVFEQRLYGVAAAFSIVVFFILLVFTLFQNRVTSATEAFYE